MRVVAARSEKWERVLEKLRAFLARKYTKIYPFVKNRPLQSVAIKLAEHLYVHAHIFEAFASAQFR